MIMILILLIIHKVTVHASELKSLVIGVWLESKKKPVGCCLADGAAVGSGAEAAPGEPLPRVADGS